MKNRIIVLLLLGVNTFIALFLLAINCNVFSYSIVLAITTTLLSFYNIIRLYNGRFVLSSALISYTILTQFGLVIPYFFCGDAVLLDYPEWTLAFLYSPYLTKSVLLAVVAISVYEIVRVLVVLCKKENMGHFFSTTSTYNHGVYLRKISFVFLLITFVYFLINILLGSMKLFGTYEQFLQSPAVKNSFYPYLLMMFYLGTIYLVASGKIQDAKKECILWLLIVVIFSLNGNKGEFLYALLASMGVVGMQGYKISKKFVIICALLLFLVIPSITQLRSIGIVGNISHLTFNPFAAFVEIGMQIRTSVYTLEDISVGNYDFLWGESYWRPIYNIITPFSNHTIATADIKATYEGFGYNQVIESYLNFSIVGVILYHSLLGFLITYMERNSSSLLKLAYVGSLTSIFINATRNHFAFVFGQILLVYIIYRIIKIYPYLFKHKYYGK